MKNKLVFGLGIVSLLVVFVSSQESKSGSSSTIGKLLEKGVEVKRNLDETVAHYPYRPMGPFRPRTRTFRRRPRPPYRSRPRSRRRKTRPRLTTVIIYQPPSTPSTTQAPKPMLEGVTVNVQHLAIQPNQSPSLLSEPNPPTTQKSPLSSSETPLQEHIYVYPDTYPYYYDDDLYYYENYDENLNANKVN